MAKEHSASRHAKEMREREKSMAEKAKDDHYEKEHEDMIQANSNKESATTQYQNAHPEMSREEAFGEVNRVSPEMLKKRFKKNSSGGYSIREKD